MLGFAGILMALPFMQSLLENYLSDGELYWTRKLQIFKMSASFSGSIKNLIYTPLPEFSFIVQHFDGRKILRLIYLCWRFPFSNQNSIAASISSPGLNQNLIQTKF